MTKLVIVQFRPIVTICPNWTMTNFQTRKSKYHIMSRTIFINVQRVNVLLTHFFLAVSMAFLNDTKIVIVKNRITIVRYPASIVIQSNFYFNPFWSDQRDCDLNRKKLGFQCFWSKWPEEDLNHRPLVWKVITITTRPFDHAFGYGKESTFI